MRGADRVQLRRTRDTPQPGPGFCDLADFSRLQTHHGSLWSPSVSLQSHDVSGLTCTYATWRRRGHRPARSIDRTAKVWRGG